MNITTASAPPKVGHVITLYLPALLVLLEDRVVGHLDVALLHVELTRDRRQVEGLDVGEEGEADLVEVRELVAVGIDAHEVRVAPEREDLVAHPRDRHPRAHGRALGVLERRVLGREQLGPGLEAGRLDELVDVVLLRVFGVEALQVVGGQEGSVGAVTAVLVGERGQEERRRLLVREAHRLGVDLLDGRRGAVGCCAATREWRASGPC